MKTIGEFKSLFDLLQAFPTEESCIEYLEKKLWKDGIPVSPYDPTSKFTSVAMVCTAAKIQVRISIYG